MGSVMTADGVVVRVIEAIAGDPGEDNGVDPDELFFWRCDDGSVQISANCNDMFAYACADREPITADNLEVFEQAVRDVVAAAWYAGYGELFAMRVRRKLPLRPQMWNVATRARWAMYEAEEAGWASTAKATT